MNNDPADKPATTPQAMQAKWLDEIARAERYFAAWYRKADKVIRLYRQADERPVVKRRFAMLWANTEILKPTLYALTPQPQVSRRFRDEDPIGLMLAQILERAASYEYECTDIDETMKAARDDLLLPGRGAAWVRQSSPEEVLADFVHWRDFLHKPARRWNEVSWVGKRSYFTKAELAERFPDADLKLAAPDNVPKHAGYTQEERRSIEGKYSVWEIWDKTAKQVYFIAPSTSVPLEVSDPLYNLRNFWPCPRPLFATLTTDSLVPIPDYQYYQDQAEEIDDLTRRIGSLTDSLKLVGFYPKGAEDSTAAIERALRPEVENEMIGIESWAAFGEKGGANAIIFLPVKQVADTIVACVELRRQLIDDVYQITGLSDILRGASDPQETLGAQELKAQTGSLRVRDRQADVQRFARDLTRIMCEIMAQKFEPKTLLEMSNMLTPENQTPEKQAEIAGAIQLMRDDRLRSFRVDIETDSTIQPDENAEKQRRIEFTTAIGTFLKEAMPIGAQFPDMLPLIGQTLQFTARGFRTGRELEDVINKTIKTMESKAEAAAQQPPPPSPQEQAAQLEQQKTQAEIAGQQQKMQAEQEMHQQRMGFEQMKGQQEMELLQKKADIEIAHTQAKHDQMLAQTAAQHQQVLSFGEQDAQAKLQQGNAIAAQGLRNQRNEAILSLRAKANGTGVPPEMEEGAEPPPDPVGEISAAFQQALAQIAQQLQQIAQQTAQSNAQLARIIQAPKQITTPDGRTYTAQAQPLQ